MFFVHTDLGVRLIASVFQIFLARLPTDARKLSPSISPSFAVLLRALMAKAKKARPSTAPEVLNLLRQITDGGVKEREKG